MKYIIAISILFLYINGMAAEPDKILHFTASALISGVTYGVARHNGLSKGKAAAIAFSTAMMVGIAKEIYDPVFDNKDIQADALGAMIVPLIGMEF